MENQNFFEFYRKNRRVIILVLLLIMLGLQTIFRNKEEPTTNIYDEINKENIIKSYFDTLNIKEQIPIFPLENQISYRLEIESTTPYELYLDDILIDENKELSVSKIFDLNMFLLKDGAYKLKLRILPKKQSKYLSIAPEDINDNAGNRWQLHLIRLIYDSTDSRGYKGKVDYEASELKIEVPTKKVKEWEQTFDINIAGLPYNLKGWSDGEDLSKWDSEVLEKEVLAYYNKLRDMLNEGRAYEFMQTTIRLDVETATAMYESQAKFEKAYRDNFKEIIEQCIGNMHPINNYEMKLYGNGKLVSLEIPEGKMKHYKALISESKSYTSSWGVYLYKPKGSNEFVAIRS